MKIKGKYQSVICKRKNYITTWNWKWLQKTNLDKICIKYVYNGIIFVQKLGMKSSPKI